jgi:hypothetical protein
MVTISTAEKALKDYYLDAVITQLNDGISPFFTAIEKSAQNVYGKDVKLAVVKGNSSSVVAGDEDGELPSAYANRYLEVSLPLKNIYGTIEITDKAIRASKDSSGAFVNLLNAEMEGLVNSAKINFARMLYGDGNGYLCNITEKTSSTKLTLDSPKKYYEGMTVDIYSSGGTKTVSSINITDINMDTGVITVSKDLSSVSISSGDKLYVSSCVGKELIGLSGIFDGTKVYGYSKSSDWYFNPKVKKLTDGFTEDDIIDVIDELDAQCDSKVNMILCSHKTRRMIADLLADKRRLVNSTDIAAGYSSVVVNDVPVYADKFCQEGRIYLLNTQDFILSQLCDWEWLENEDGKILKQVSGKAAYSATLVKYAELICKRPYGQGLITF